MITRKMIEQGYTRTGEVDKKDKERKEKIEAIRTKLQNKPFKNLNGKEKDLLIETMAQILGIID